MISALIYALAAFIEGVIGLRFLFLLLGANHASAIVNWVYSWSEPFVRPFYGIFGQSSAVTSVPGLSAPSVFDWTALVALVIYGVVAGVAGRLTHRRSMV